MMHYSPNREGLYRSLWLGVTVFYYLVYPCLVLALIQFIFGTNPLFVRQIHHPLMLVAVVALFGMALLIPFWIVYHCAYKNRGNRFLTFCLITGPLKVGLAFFQLFKQPMTPWIIGLFIADFCLYATWYFFSLYLWKANAEAKRKKQVVFLHDCPLDEALPVVQK